jgi:hypothetical protein
MDVCLYRSKADDAGVTRRYGAVHHFGGCVSASPATFVNFGVSRNEMGGKIHQSVVSSD